MATNAVKKAIAGGLDPSQPYTVTKQYGGGGISGEYSSARQANEQRYAQAMAIYDEIIKRYQPGGTFGKAALGQLETQKVRDVGRETQQMISSGLYGTTTTAGLPTKWEAEVGAPSRLRLEDIMMQRLSQAQIGKAGFIERREDVYPDVGAYAGYEAQAARAPQRSLSERWAEFTARTQAGRISKLGGGGVTPGKPAYVVEGGGGYTPYAGTAPSPGAPQAEYKPLEEIMQGVTYEWADEGKQPAAGAKAEPTIAEYLQQHGVDPTSTDPKIMGRARTLQKQWAGLYR